MLDGRLREALARLNPTVSHEGLEEAFRKLTRISSTQPVDANHELHYYLVNGVSVEYLREGGTIGYDPVRVVDFDVVENNDWLVLNQLTVSEGGHTRRPDVVVFLNGLPIAVLDRRFSVGLTDVAFPPGSAGARFVSAVGGPAAATPSETPQDVAVAVVRPVVFVPTHVLPLRATAVAASRTGRRGLRGEYRRREVVLRQHPASPSDAQRAASGVPIHGLGSVGIYHGELVIPITVERTGVGEGNQDQILERCQLSRRHLTPIQPRAAAARSRRTSVGSPGVVEPVLAQFKTDAGFEPNVGTGACVIGTSAVLSARQP